jgi:hypothetical protein
MSSTRCSTRRRLSRALRALFGLSCERLSSGLGSLPNRRLATKLIAVETAMLVRMAVRLIGSPGVSSTTYSGASLRSSAGTSPVMSVSRDGSPANTYTPCAGASP